MVTAELHMDIYQQGLTGTDTRGQELCSLTMPPAVSSQAPCTHLPHILPLLLLGQIHLPDFLFWPRGFFPVSLNFKFPSFLSKASLKFILSSCPYPMLSILGQGKASILKMANHFEPVFPFLKCVFTHYCWMPQHSCSSHTWSSGVTEARYKRVHTVWF